MIAMYTSIILVVGTNGWVKKKSRKKFLKSSFLIHHSPRPRVRVGWSRSPRRFQPLESELNGRDTQPLRGAAGVCGVSTVQ